MFRRLELIIEIVSLCLLMVGEISCVGSVLVIRWVVRCVGLVLAVLELIIGYPPP